MGRVTFPKILLASVLVCGAAVAQQGMVVPPWNAPSPVVAPPATLTRKLPASGLPPAAAALPAPRPVEAAPAPAVAPLPAGKWTPPVVTLLVDPWARPDALAPPSHPRWVPESSDIVDPWASEPPAEPRVAASRSAGVPHDTIF